MQDSGGLVPHVDPTTLIGNAAPQLWRVLDADQNAFAVGDVVVDSRQSIAGVPIARLYGAPAVAGGYGSADERRTSLLASSTNAFGVVVGIAPSLPFAPGQPVIAAGGGSNRQLWILPALEQLFEIRGDASTPARGEFAGAGNSPLNLSAQNVNDGALFARIRYGTPLGGQSGVRLAGNSFTDAHVSSPNVPGGHGELAVVGVAPGAALAPGAPYRVRLRGFI